MKAAIITDAGKSPVYGDFREPVASEGNELITVSASALSQFSKSRSSGAHYSSDGVFPAVAGADGVGRTADGRRVYFVLPEAPFGALAEKSLVRSRQCVAIPEGIEDVTAAALAERAGHWTCKGLWYSSRLGRCQGPPLGTMGRMS